MHQLASQQNLGQGNVTRLFFKLAIPTVVSQLVNVLYNIVDRMYIGHMPETGVDALTGLGLCFPIIMIVSAFSSLCGVAGAPKAAIAMGQKNSQKAEKIMGNCITMLLISAVLLTGVLLVFGEKLLYLFGASDVTVVYALGYLRVYAIGTLFVQLSLGLNMFITTQGFAKYSMATVLIGAIANIILDPIFIYGLNLGVQGAALATILSQALSAVWVLKFLTGSRSILKIRPKNMVLKPAIFLPVLALGLSPFVMQSTESLLNVCFNVSLQKYGGDLAVGAMTILSSTMTVFLMPMQGLCQGGQPIISYNYGAGNADRVKAAIRVQVIACVAFTVCCWTFVMLFPQVLIGLFNDDPDLMDITVWAMRIYAAGLFMLGVQVSCQQAFMALGQAKVSLLLACLRKLILLIPLIFILPNFFEDQLFAVFVAEPISDIIAAIITGLTFLLVMRKLMPKKVKKELGA